MTQRLLVLFLSMVMTCGATTVRADRRIATRTENRAVPRSDFYLNKQTAWEILAGCPESVGCPESSSHVQPKAKKVVNLDDEETTAGDKAIRSLNSYSASTPVVEAGAATVRDKRIRSLDSYSAETPAAEADALAAGDTPAKQADAPLPVDTRGAQAGAPQGASAEMREILRRPDLRIDGNWLALEINRRNDGIEETTITEIDGNALAQEINRLNDGLVRVITSSLPVRQHNLDRSKAANSELSLGGKKFSAGWQAASLFYASEALLTDLSWPAASAGFNGQVAQAAKSGGGKHYRWTALSRTGKDAIYRCSEIQLDLDQYTPCAGDFIPSDLASTDEKPAQVETASPNSSSWEGDANAQPFNDVHSNLGQIENGEDNDWELAPGAVGQEINPVGVEVSPIASLPFSIAVDLDTISHTQDNPELCWELPQAIDPAVNGWEGTGVMAQTPSIAQVALGRRPDFNEQGLTLNAFSPLAESAVRSMMQVGAHIAAGAARTLRGTLHIVYDFGHPERLIQARRAVPYRGL